MHMNRYGPYWRGEPPASPPGSPAPLRRRAPTRCRAEALVSVRPIDSGRRVSGSPDDRKHESLF